MPPDHEELRIVSSTRLRRVVPKEHPPHPPKKLVLKPEIYGLGVPIHSFWGKVCATHVDGNQHMMLSGEVSSHRVGLVLLQITCSMRCAMGHACICW